MFLKSVKLHIIFTTVRVVGGQSRKMAKPIFGRGLAMRCEHSEHGKSQLSVKYLCVILILLFKSLVLFINSLFFSNLSNFTKLSTLFNLIFRFQIALRCPRLADNVVAASRRRGFHKGSGGR